MIFRIQLDDELVIDNICDMGYFADSTAAGNVRGERHHLDQQ